MSEAKHTPGPWAWEDYNLYSNSEIGLGGLSSNCGPVLWYGMDGEENIYTGKPANAKLIAAAPELLGACIMATKSDSFTRLNTAAQRAITAALQKAEG